MSNAPLNQGRRRFLTATTAVVGGLGAVAVAVPFIKSWNPSAKAKAAGAPVEVEISKLEEGRWFVLNGVVSLFGWFVVHKLSLKV